MYDRTTRQNQLTVYPSASLQHLSTMACIVWLCLASAATWFTLKYHADIRGFSVLALIGLASLLHIGNLLQGSRTYLTVVNDTLTFHRIFDTKTINLAHLKRVSDLNLPHLDWYVYEIWLDDGDTQMILDLTNYKVTDKDALATVLNPYITRPTVEKDFAYIPPYPTEKLQEIKKLPSVKETMTKIALYMFLPAIIITAILVAIILVVSY